MGQITLTVPTNGQANSIADPNVSTDLTILQTVINGGLDGTNIAAASGIHKFAYRNMASSATAASGDWVLANAGVTVTLPAPATNAMVAITTDSLTSSASPVTVSGTNIYGIGLSAATSFQLGTAVTSVILQSSGVSWIIIAGQQDTGWVALTLGAGVSSSGGYTPAARLVGDRVYLKGALAGTSITSWATIPAGHTPAGTVEFGPYLGGSLISISSAGALASSTASSAGLGLDNISYSLS